VPWQSGHYYLFSKLLINSVVPSESGVYAIYSTREQVFIAESGNLRRALLDLYRDMVRFGPYRATGFTFELCPERCRVKRVKQLFTEHERICHERAHNHVLYG
jgi:hypothetical protein